MEEIKRLFADCIDIIESNEFSSLEIEKGKLLAMSENVDSVCDSEKEQFLHDISGIINKCGKVYYGIGDVLCEIIGTLRDIWGMEE